MQGEADHRHQPPDPRFIVPGGFLQRRVRLGDPPLQLRFTAHAVSVRGPPEHDRAALRRVILFVCALQRRHHGRVRQVLLFESCDVGLGAVPSEQVVARRFSFHRVRPSLHVRWCCGVLSDRPLAGLSRPPVSEVKLGSVCKRTHPVPNGQDECVFESRPNDCAGHGMRSQWRPWPPPSPAHRAPQLDAVLRLRVAARALAPRRVEAHLEPGAGRPRRRQPPAEADLACCVGKPEPDVRRAGEAAADVPTKPCPTSSHISTHRVFLRGRCYTAGFFLDPVEINQLCRPAGLG